MFAPFPQGPTTILVVDDEPISRRVAYRILSEEGFRVLEASTCAETLDALSQANGRVDLLLVDVVMPECDGVTIGRRVLEQWPRQKILYMSAHPAEVLARHGHETLDVPFLAKPYTRGEVLAKVREALEQEIPRKMVLVVDDDADMRSSLGKMLKHAGYEVTMAENGAEAIRMCREIRVNLVILDLFMPTKDGIETILELRAANRSLPIIAMSGGGKGLNMLPEAKLLGAYGTIQKPFTTPEMMTLVEGALHPSRTAKS